MNAKGGIFNPAIGLEVRNQFLCSTSSPSYFFTFIIAVVDGSLCYWFIRPILLISFTFCEGKKSRRMFLYRSVRISLAVCVYIVTFFAAQKLKIIKIHY